MIFYRNSFIERTPAVTYAELPPCVAELSAFQNHSKVPARSAGSLAVFRWEVAYRAQRSCNGAKLAAVHCKDSPLHNYYTMRYQHIDSILCEFSRF